MGGHPHHDVINSNPNYIMTGDLPNYMYDKRIDEYNWYMLFFVQMMFYFLVQFLVRAFSTGPGDIKKF